MPPLWTSGDPRNVSMKGSGPDSFIGVVGRILFHARPFSSI